MAAAVAGPMVKPADLQQLTFGFVAPRQAPHIRLHSYLSFRAATKVVETCQRAGVPACVDLAPDRHRTDADPWRVYCSLNEHYPARLATFKSHNPPVRQ